MKMIKMMMMMMMMMMIAMMMMGVALGDIVDETCKKVHDYNQNLCVSLLRSDPHSSSSTNTTGLALILVDIVKVHGTKTLEYMNKIYKTKPKLKVPLDKCIQIYRSLIFRGVNDAIAAMKGFGYPASSVNSLCIQASICEDGFSKGQSPLASWSQRMDTICDVAVDVAALVKF